MTHPTLSRGFCIPSAHQRKTKEVETWQRRPTE
ncbi:hypothetical protein HYQ19_gp069 [Arthrobacter phage DrYang]|uniref:Uncharacterized protein n=1 Tax=Arthrobacter phage DrYang TaxID=2686080 RepID=A0A6B9J8G1_9CAUD|nr:hypothetical protein HYQ19_gp069 [Arthrobacter phage DrYang]QGZ17168.1 hypothetical protein SEA_DRYANG_69 [Arthrobacter phage DrYang]